MRNNIRLQLNSAGTCDAFCQAHPDPNPANQTVATRLHDLVSQSTTLSQLQHSSLVARNTAIDHKTALRASISEAMAAIIGIAKATFRAEPASAVRLRPPRGRTNETAFLTSARVAVAEVQARKDLFIRFGMPETLLDTVTAELNEYEAAVVRQRNALVTQVGASAELAAVTREVMIVLKHLDALHRLRFKNDPDMQAAWKSARNVAYRLPESVPATPQAA